MTGNRNIAKPNSVTLSVASRDDVSARALAAFDGGTQALIQSGVIDRTDDGIMFPYDAVHVDFMLKAA